MGSRVRFAEEEPEPGLEVYQPPKKAPEGPQAEMAPEVYWADDADNDQNAAKYTFYREGTPTPPDYEEAEKPALGYGVAAALAALPGPPVPRAAAPTGRIGRVPPPIPPFPPFAPLEAAKMGGESIAESQDEHPTTRRKYRWVVLLLIFLFVAIPIGLGVGLGIGLRQKATGAALAASGSSSGATSPNATASTTGVTASPNATPTSSAASVATQTTTTTVSPSSSATTGPNFVPNPDCPALNNTIYSVPGSTKTFLRTCGVDYSGVGGATDLSNVYTNSMAECMNACASYDRCTGCGWGQVTGDTGPSHRCWMKDDLRAPHLAAENYCFAILQS